MNIYFIYIFFIDQINEHLSYLCGFFLENLTQRGRTEISAIISAQRRVWSPSYDHSAHTSKIKVKRKHTHFADKCGCVSNKIEKREYKKERKKERKM